MNNPNNTPPELIEPEDLNNPPPEPAIEETTPRSYIIAGIVAALGIVLLCVIGVAVLSSGALSPRPTPTPTPGNVPRLDIIGTLAPNTPLEVHGVNFAPNERVEIYVAYTPGASFNQFIKIGEAQASADGSFRLVGMKFPPSDDFHGTLYIVGRGISSGFSPVEAITQDVTMPATTSIPINATATPEPLASSTPLPGTPTNTPEPATPTDTVEPPTPTPADTPDAGAVGVWIGHYYDNPDLSEPAVFVRYDPNLSFNWHTGSPGGGIPNTYYSVSWTRNENFKSTDNYIFTLNVDDGARVYLDDELIINEWHIGGARTVAIGHGVLKGVHALRVEYFQTTGNAQISLSWGVKYNGWIARYYNSPDLSGPLALKRDDADINFDWGAGSPAPEVNPDQFSVDWTRTVNFPAAGNYVFTAVVDDGVRVYVDGKSTPVLDNFDASGSTTINGSVHLGAGKHTLEVQYVERTGLGRIQLTWALEAPPPPPPPPPPPTDVPPGTVHITGPHTGMINETYSFTATVNPNDTSTPLTFSWTGTNVSPIINTHNHRKDSVSFTWTVTGSQTLNVTVNNDAGTVSESYNITIGAPPPPPPPPPTPPASVSVSGPITVQVGTTYAFTATVNPVSVSFPITYTWQATNQSPIVDTANNRKDSVSFMWSVTGTQHLTITAANAGGVVTKTQTISATP